MQIILTIIPYLFSFLTGYLLLELIFSGKRKPSLLTHCFLAMGLGLGTGAALTFLVYVLLGGFSQTAIAGVHLGAVLILFMVLQKKDGPTMFRSGRERTFTLSDGLSLIVLLLFFIPVRWYADIYPQGGWDAWSVWNFKAKFLLLSGQQWTNIFDPVLWRASPHYPLLLPLTVVWGWTLPQSPLASGPQLVGLLFTLMTCGLLLAALRDLTKNPLAVIAPLLLISLPFFVLLSISQYCDIVVAYYLLASLFCLAKTFQGDSRPYACLSGLFLGLLSFTKPEGLVAALILLALTAGQFLFWAKPKNTTVRTQIALAGIVGIVLGFIPAAIFQLFFSPGNQTLINGLSSADHPVTLYRLKMIFAFLGAELIGEKWGGLWGLLGVAVIVLIRSAFRKEIRLIPLFLTLYMGVVLFYYFLNTYFKIEWWLQVSLHRILFSLLPAFLLWVFYALAPDTE